MVELKSSETVHHIVLKIPVRLLALGTLSLTALSLGMCFITAVLFYFDEVNHMMCGVQNSIPSVSAVTGILPQAYLWRTCIALHSIPRFGLSSIYFNYYMSYLSVIPSKWVAVFKLLVHLNFWINFVECSCDVLVAYISNTENYPVHEKLFVVFLVTALCYMALSTILFGWCHNTVMSKLERQSYWWKKFLLASILSATAGLIFFFIQHRIFCTPGAFNKFSLCEYVIGYTNMGYHFTCYLDFKEKYLFVGNLQPKESSTNETNGSNSNFVEKKQL